MYNIHFIGNQNIEFASRWRRELVPDQVQAGKYLSIDYNTLKRFSDGGFKDKVLSLRESDKNKLRKQARQSREDNKINKNPVVNDNLDNKIYKSNKTSLSAKGQQKLKELKSAYKKRKFIANIGKAKSFISKNKLSIGTIGLATAGAIGYGLIRKMRSDKGKKRGFYNK